MMPRGSTLSLLSPNWELMPSDLTNLDIFIVSFIVRFSSLSAAWHVTVPLHYTQVCRLVAVSRFMDRSMLRPATLRWKPCFVVEHFRLV